MAEKYTRTGIPPMESRAPVPKTMERRNQAISGKDGKINIFFIKFALTGTAVCSKLQPVSF